MGIFRGARLHMQKGAVTWTGNRTFQARVRTLGAFGGLRRSGMLMSRRASRTGAGAFGGLGAFKGRGRGWRRFLAGRGTATITPQMLGVARGLTQRMSQLRKSKHTFKRLMAAFSQR
jgi:hypothetical protein